MRGKFWRDVITLRRHQKQRHVTVKLQHLSKRAIPSECADID